MSFYDVDLEKQIAGKHILWDIEKLIRFSSLVYRLKDLKTDVGRTGYGVECGLRCMYMQFHYDLSDRQLEERLRFDQAFRWFAGFTAFEETPITVSFVGFENWLEQTELERCFKQLQRGLSKLVSFGKCFDLWMQQP